jgi:hypothetical protein
LEHEGLDFLWVFNVGVGNSRELRFWTGEIASPRQVRQLKISEVVRRIVPRRELPGQYCGLRNWEVGELLRVPRQTLITLRADLGAVIHDGGVWVPRAAVERFLTHRWIYGQPAAIAPGRFGGCQGSGRVVPPPRETTRSGNLKVLTT